MVRYLRSLLLVLLTLYEVGNSFRQSSKPKEIEDKDYWLSMGSAKLSEVLERRQRNTQAKNIIVFVGDGMGLATITAGRIYKGGESHVLSFEKFPATGLSKTYNTDNMVSDSASTATAIFTGVKTKKHVVGYDTTADYDECHAEKNKKATVTSYMTWAQESGRDTGIVTTMRITHDTPASTYAHINNKKWECDSRVPLEYVNCTKDVARQLVEDSPGKNFKVIFGGGRNEMGDGLGGNGAFCLRNDGRNLTDEWKNRRKNSAYVKTAEELRRVDIDNTDFLLGLFAPEHMNYTIEDEPTRPSLKLMTETAIRLLQKNKNGFALMVEGGLIDYGHHDNMPALVLPEVVDFDEAIDAAVRMTDAEDTLIIVTADHSHTMSLNGYPPRGSDILGLASNTSESPYETLTYANGQGFASQKDRGNTKQNIYHRHSASVYLRLETHGGEDVPIYASGPMSHLLVGVHEENYIASVISSALGEDIQYRKSST